jgi:hypothetical protein
VTATGRDGHDGDAPASRDAPASPDDADRSGDSAAGELPDAARLPPQQALYFYGVSRARSWRGRRVAAVQAESELMRIRYRDLEALVRPVPYEVPLLDEAGVRAHHEAVEAASRRTTILPAPFGIVFRGRRQLIRMLQDQYLVLDEGLSLLEGHWELRLHIIAAGAGEPDLELSDVAMQLYSELRRSARAAVPFPAEGRRLMSAAYLVERSAWLEFMDRAEELNSAHGEVTFDITGPWPAYDFVRLAV